MKLELAGRTVRHVVTGVDPGPDQESSADHPLFRAHPLSGQVALYLSTPQRCVSISGFDPTRSRELIGQLFAHSTQADNVYRHTWLPGDVVMWDNGCVMHRADHDGVIGARIMHRGMVADYQRIGSAVRNTVRTLSALTLLVVALPANLLVTGLALLGSSVIRRRPAVRSTGQDGSDQRRQDDEGAAAGPLVLAAGHRVVLVESAATASPATGSPVRWIGSTSCPRRRLTGLCAGAAGDRPP